MKASTPSVLGFGEVLWDMLPSGRRLGGAPLNVTAHLRRMGFAAAYLTAVGDDEPGIAALAGVAALGIDVSLVRKVPDLPTGRAEVTLGPGGEPRFDIVRPAAYDRLADADATGRAPRLPEPGPEIMVYGTLAAKRPATLALLHRFADRLTDALLVYDVNLRPGQWTPALVDSLAVRAGLLKVSEHELRILSGSQGISAVEIEPALRALADRYGLRAVACSRGAAGGALLLDGDYAELPAPHVIVEDAVGAGDAFTAATAHGVVTGLPVHAVLRQANALGALVASRAGAIPQWSAHEWPPVDLSRPGFGGD